MNNSYQKILESGIKSFEFYTPEFFTEETLEKLLSYHQLLIKWNKAYNLTAIRDPEQMISRHVLDSLSIVPYLQGSRFIDVGTGAGLPGIVLAVCYPEKHFSLLDSNGKKTRFLFQVKTELNLANVTVHHGRVEQYQTDLKYDGVISRAFASLEDMLKGSYHLIAEQGCFYAMKGVYPQQEIEQLAELNAQGKNFMVEASHRLNVPGEEGQRHLVVIAEKTALPTPVSH